MRPTAEQHIPVVWPFGLELPVCAVLLPVETRPRTPARDPMPTFVDLDCTP